MNNKINIKKKLKNKKYICKSKKKLIKINFFFTKKFFFFFFLVFSVRITTFERWLNRTSNLEA